MIPWLLPQYFYSSLNIAARWILDPLKYTSKQGTSLWQTLSFPFHLKKKPKALPPLTRANPPRLQDLSSRGSCLYALYSSHIGLLVAWMHQASTHLRAFALIWYSLPLKSSSPRRLTDLCHSSLRARVISSERTSLATSPSSLLSSASLLSTLLTQ